MNDDEDENGGEDDGHEDPSSTSSDEPSHDEPSANESGRLYQSNVEKERSAEQERVDTGVEIDLGHDSRNKAAASTNKGGTLKLDDTTQKHSIRLEPTLCMPEKVGERRTRTQRRLLKINNQFDRRYHYSMIYPLSFL